MPAAKETKKEENRGFDREKVVVRNGTIYDFDDESIFTEIVQVNSRKPYSDGKYIPFFIIYRFKDTNQFYKVYMRDLDFSVLNKGDVRETLEDLGVKLETYEKAGIELRTIEKAGIELRTIAKPDPKDPDPAQGFFQFWGDMIRKWW